MYEIGAVLPVVLKSYIARGEPRIIEVLAPFWPRVAGKAIAQNSRPVAFAGGTLILATSTPPWAVQLRVMSEEIRAAINGFLGGQVIKKLRIELSRSPELNVSRMELGN